jgi:hypothetical protein
VAKGNRSPRSQHIREGLRIYGKKVGKGYYRYSVDFHGVHSSGKSRLENLHYYMDSLECERAAQSSSAP